MNIILNSTQGLTIIIQQTLIYLQDSIYPIPIRQYSMKNNKYYFKTNSQIKYLLGQIGPTTPIEGFTTQNHSKTSSYSLQIKHQSLTPIHNQQSIQE
jgi:hypothetical protein